MRWERTEHDDAFPEPLVKAGWVMVALLWFGVIVESVWSL